MSKILPIALIGLLALAWMSLPPAEAPIGVSSAQAEATSHYFPAGFVIQPNDNEPEVYEYY
jgi:hypothetical protein